jgi:hypothetical protein
MTYVIGKACVDLGDRACVEECPAGQHQHLANNAAFSLEALPDGALGSAGGAANVGPLGADTPLLAGMPAQER